MAITICPYCERQWRSHTEQAVAVERAGMCVACSVQYKQDVYSFGISEEARLRTGEILEAGRVAQLESIERELCDS